MKDCGTWLAVIVVVLLGLLRVGRHFFENQPAFKTLITVLLGVIIVIWLLWLVLARVLLPMYLRRKLGQAAGVLPRTAEQWLAWQQRWEQERDQKRAEREQRRQARKQADRTFFCEELPSAPEEKRKAETDEARLQRLGLPVLQSERELADWLGIALPRLRWFTHHKPVDRVSHYVRYQIPKRSGGTRTILAPKRDLKKIQRKVLRDILDLVPNADCCHGFARGKSIVTNAGPHVGKQAVLNLDLKDFFPSITYPRVRGMFMNLGYSFAVASTLALLCTECEREPFDRDDERFYVSVAPRRLIQGAPTSPAIANLVSWRLDKRLCGLARKHDVSYTRYADDLTFSGDNIDGILRILSAAPRIIADEGFETNREKTRLYRPSSKQVVTGLVVNDKVNTPRELRRQIRAIIHNAKKTGLNSQNRDGRPNFRAYLNGLISFIHSVSPEEAEQLRNDLVTVPD